MLGVHDVGIRVWHQCVPAGVLYGDEWELGTPVKHVMWRNRNDGKWRTELQIVMWNVRGGMEQKMNELLDVMDDAHMDVVCVIEIKRMDTIVSGPAYQKVSEGVKV